ncbi:MAG: hypothetical protein KTR31_22890 [Myxococcales bacterium]|nr:hypothetical protein [Myxococcales bacterium]
MTLRLVKLLALGAALCACEGDTTDSLSTKDLTDTDVNPTAGTGGGGSRFFDATEIHFSSSFGYAKADIVTAELDKTPLPPSIDISLGLQGWGGNFSAVGDYCTIVMPLDSATDRLGAKTDPRLYYGVDYNDLKDPPFTNCHTENYELNPNRWGTDVVASFVDNYGSGTYHVNVGEPSSFVRDVFKSYAPKDLEFVIGGALGVGAGLPGLKVPGQIDDFYCFSYQMDVTNTVVVDKAGLLVPQTLDEVNVGDGQIASGYYSCRSLVFWSIQ